MFLFTLSALIILAGLFVAFTVNLGDSPLLPKLVGILILVVGVSLMAASTAIYVEDNQGGIVIRKFGQDLPPGRIVSTDGQKGPQAYVLPPGWHFRYWPWLFDLSSVDNIDIPKGNIGIVTAKDGLPMPEGEVFAPEWSDYNKMLDGVVFLTEGKGIKGPQLTVLPPGQYRYNDRLFKIELKPALEVNIGEVAVIKANAGPIYTGSVQTVNGVSIVPKGYRGIWMEPLMPNAYYLNPDAFIVTKVQTTTRIYDYSGEKAISTRTKDSFEFPVELRVACNIAANDAPYVVAHLGNPDAVADKDGFTVIEEKAVLPSLRTIIRNTAETRLALEYVSMRSTIGDAATENLKKALSQFKVGVDNVFIANIGLSHTPAGQKLLETQTEKEIADQQKTMYQKQQEAETSRSDVVRAKTSADQQEQMVQSEIAIKVAKNQADAKANLAVGDAAYAREQVAALGGSENYIRIQTINKLAEVLPSLKLPEQLIIGGGADGLNTAVLSKLFAQPTK